MAKHTSYQGVKLSEFNIKNDGASILSDALKGYHARKWDEVLKLTVFRGHCILSSDVLEEDTEVSMELPQHKPFYIHIANDTGMRMVLVENHIENLQLAAGEQVLAVFTTEV